MNFVGNNGMEFYIETSDFQNIVKLLSVTAKNNTNDTTGRILIDASSDGLVFISDNKSNSLVVDSTNNRIITNGVCSVSYTNIKSFVSSFLSWDESSKTGLKEFHFKYDAAVDSLIITVANICENGKKSHGRVEFKGFDPEAIDRPESFNKENFVINSSIFRKALSKVLYAINPGNPVPAIRNMNISFDEENIYFVGTNGTVISEYSIKNISDLKEGNFVIKYDFIMGLRRAIGDETQLQFEVTERKIKVKFDNILYSGNTSNNNVFPDYKYMFDQYENVISLNKDILKGSLLPFSDLLDSGDYNRLTLTIKDRKIYLSSDVMDFEYSDNIDFDGNFVIDIDGNVLIQAILSTEDDTIFIKFSNSDTFVIVDSFNFENQKSLLMPISRRY